MRSLTTIAALGCLLCTAGTASADGRTAPLDVALFERGSAPELLTTPACAAAGRPALFESEAIAASTSGCCTATCWDGSSRTCCGTSCSAVDSSCPGQQGYCWSNSEGYKYCPTCAPCQNYDCGCENQPCVKDWQCGTCFGYQCVCRGTVGNKHCLCP